MVTTGTTHNANSLIQQLSMSHKNDDENVRVTYVTFYAGLTAFVAHFCVAT